MKQDSLQILDLVAQTIYDKKGFNIFALDVREISTLTNFFIIAEGNIDKHVIALAKAVIEKLKEVGLTPNHCEGIQQGDWIVIDYMDLVIHLFMPGMREKYQLEELWHEGKIIDVKITTPFQNSTGSLDSDSSVMTKPQRSL